MFELVPCALVLWAKGPDGYQRARMSIKYWCSHLKEQSERVGRDRERDTFFFNFKKPRGKFNSFNIKKIVLVQHKIRENNTGGTTELLLWLASPILTFLVLKLRKKWDADRGHGEWQRDERQSGTYFKNMGQKESKSSQAEAGSSGLWFWHQQHVIVSVKQLHESVTPTVQ